VQEKIASADSPEQADTFKNRALDVTTIKTINFTNVKKERTQGKGNKKPMPWDISNVSVSYSYSQIKHRDPIIENDELNDYRGTLDYNYTRKATYIQPFKKLKPKGLKFIKELNFNPLPNSFTFNTIVKRMIGVTKYRLPETPIFEFEDRRFDWDRRYGFQWDLTKSLKLSFNALNTGVVDEYKRVGIGTDQTFVNARGEDVGNVSEDERKKYVKDNFYDFGRTKNYSHQVNVNYTLPFKYLPGLEWISSKASYSSGYTWSASALNVVDTLGNVIQNNQTRSLNATFSFDKLYKKIGFLSKIEGKGSSNRNSRNRNPKRDDKGDKTDTIDDKNSKDRKKKTSDGPSAITKILIRPLLLLRDVRFSYKEASSTVVPGFMPRPDYFGLSDGFSAPGWAFALGAQPDIDFSNQNNWLRNAASNEWLVTNRLFNQQVQQRNTQDYEVKIKLEPFKDFKIDINMKKTFRMDHTEEFKNTSDIAGSPTFEQLALRDLGSFEVTYFALNTLFNDDIVGLFQTFETNREIISARLPNNSVDPHEIDGTPYIKGYGKESNNVLVPAFLAAYTGQDPNTTDLDIQNVVSKRGYFPKPNWTLRYDGLSKMPGLKDIFSSFTITHGYKSTLVVNSFNSDPKYNSGDPFALSDLETNRNYHTRLDIPQIVINEQFSPIIGIDIKTRNDMNLEFNYKKSRNLQLLAQEPALKETRTTEYVFGFGWTLKDVNIGFLTGGSGKKRGKSRDKKDEEAKAKDQNSRGGRGGSSVTSSARTLSIKFDFAFRDDVTYNHKPDEIAGDPQRGLKSLRFSPSIDYDINKNLTMRMFFDFSRTKPYLTTSYPITSAQGGLTIRFNLN
jgi:cell surface protein SprA